METIHQTKSNELYATELCIAEKKSRVVTSLIELFGSLQNLPSSIATLAQSFTGPKGPMTWNSSTNVRNSIEIWDDIAKKNKLGMHEQGLDGCTKKSFHRVCKRKEGKNPSLFWINKVLAPSIFSIAKEEETLNPVPTTTISETPKQTKRRSTGSLGKKQLSSKEMVDRECQTDPIPGLLPLGSLNQSYALDQMGPEMNHPFNTVPAVSLASYQEQMLIYPDHDQHLQSSFTMPMQGADMYHQHDLGIPQYSQSLPRNFGMTHFNGNMSSSRARPVSWEQPFLATNLQVPQEVDMMIDNIDDIFKFLSEDNTHNVYHGLM